MFSFIQYVKLLIIAAHCTDEYGSSAQSEIRYGRGGIVKTIRFAYLLIIRVCFYTLVFEQNNYRFCERTKMCARYLYRLSKYVLTVRRFCTCTLYTNSNSVKTHFKSHLYFFQLLFTLFKQKRENGGWF